MKPYLRFCCSFLLTVTFLLSSVNAYCSEAATPVAESPHRLAVTADRREHANLGPGTDGHYTEDGDYYGVSASYLYRSQRWLELGARVSYGGANYIVNDVFYVGGVARGALPMDSEKRWEVGLALTLGTVMMTVPSIYDDNNYSNSRSHHFLGVMGAVEPDLRWWVTPKLAFSFAGHGEVGRAFDVVQVEGSNLSSSLYAINWGGSLGVVVTL
jgi:hypothetical protein